MDAIVVGEFGTTDVLKLEKIETLLTPAEKQIVVKIKAAGVFSVDTYMRKCERNGNMIELPYIPGVGAAGIVESVGDGVTQHKPGDRVFTVFHRTQGSGCYAHYGIFDADGVFPLPDEVDFACGATVGVPHFTACFALIDTAEVKPTDIVLIHNALSAYGRAAIQICRSAGVKNIVGTVGNETDLELVKLLGAKHAYDDSVVGYEEKLVKDVGKPNLIFKPTVSDCWIDSNPMFKFELMTWKGRCECCELLENDGTIIVAGALPTGIVVFSWRAKQFYIKTLLDTPSSTARVKKEWKSIGAKIVKGLKNGAFTTHIEKLYLLENAAKAHAKQEQWTSGSNGRGSIVLSLEE